MRLHLLIAKAVRGGFGRTTLAATGVAGSTVLVLTLLAAYQSLIHGVTAYAGQPGIDLWIAARGTDNMIRSGSTIPARWEDAVRAVPGVAAVDPVLRSFATVEANQAGASPRLTLLTIGYRGPDGMGGPSFVSSGRPPRATAEIALDRAAAFQLKVGIGDAVRVDGLTVTVAGLTSGTNLISTQFLFGDYHAAEAALGVSGRASFLAVRLQTGTDPQAQARVIRSLLPQASVMTRREFVSNNLREVSVGFLPLLAVLVGVGLAVSSALVGLLAHGLIQERRTDVAVLFALGASISATGAALLSSVLRVVVGGAALGAAGASLLGLLLDRWMPTVELTYQLRDLVGTMGLFGIAGLLATLIPLLHLGRIQALEAFRP